MKGILVLVSKPENEDNKSRSRLDARDWRRFFLGLVSKPEIKCQKFSVSSRCARLNQRNSHSRLENEKMTLADLCKEMGWWYVEAESLAEYSAPEQLCKLLIIEQEQDSRQISSFLRWRHLYI